jgi:hypothetical protein
VGANEPLELRIAPTRAPGGYRFTASASGATFPAMANPVTIGLTIGNDSGAATIVADIGG